MKNIILIGEWYSTNLGDGVICNVVKKMMSSEVIIIPFDLSLKERYSISHDEIDAFNVKKTVKQYKKYIISNILKKVGVDVNYLKSKNYYKNYYKIFENIIINNHPKALVFAGGQLFSENFIDRLYLIYLLANKYQIPMLFNACGFGQIVGWRTKKKLNEILNSNIPYISMRDGINEVKKLSTVNIIDTFDSALAVNLYYDIDFIKSNSCVGFGVMLSPFQPIEKQYNFWFSLIRYCVNENIKFKFFCIGNIEDYQFAKYIIKKMKLNSDLYLVKRPSTPEELIYAIVQFKSIITMRLHSMIIAYSFKIPAVCIEWHRKVREFFEKMDITDRIINYNTKPKDVFNLLDNKKDKFTMYDYANSIICENIKQILKIIK